MIRAPSVVNRSPRAAGVTIALCVLLVAITSASSIFMMAIAQFRQAKDSFFSRLGTDIATATSRADFIVKAYGDSGKRSEAFDEMASEYLLDERIHCIEIAYPGSKVQLPPTEACEVLNADDVIEQRFGADGQGVARFHISYERFNLDNRHQLLLAMAAFAATGASFLVATLILVRLAASSKARQAVETLDRIFLITPVIILEVSKNNELLRMSRRLADSLPALEAGQNHSLDSIFESDSAALLKSCIASYLGGDANPCAEEICIRFRLGDLSGSLFYADIEPNPLAAGATYFISMSDVSALAGERDKLSELLKTDFLTGARSRRFMEQEYTDGTRGRDMGIVMIDLDYFKSINDSYGHVVGDCFLRHVATSLRSGAPAGSSVIRLSGEEFAVLTPESREHYLLDYANRVKDQLASDGLDVANNRLVRTVSIGVARLETGDSLSDCLRVADYALLLSKRNGRNRATYVSREEFDRQLKDRPTTEEVELAVRSGAIGLHCEPVYDSSLGRIIGFETLLRWQSGSRNLPPLSFLDAYYHVTNRLSSGRSRLDLFVETSKKFGLGGEDRPWLSYNLWPADFDAGLIDWLSSLEPSFRAMMVLEVSEQLLASRCDEQGVASILRAASALGCRIALDDFGVDGSNLVRLQDFPVDIVKIDKALVTGLAENSVNVLIIESLATLAAKLGVSVIAEGVESQSDAELLARAGVVWHQGFWYGKAMPVETACALLASPGDPGLRSVPRHGLLNDG